MTFYPSSQLLLEPIASNIARNRGAMLARGVALGAIERRVAAGGLAYLVPGAGQIVAGATIAMTAWDLWNAFQGVDLPFPAASIPYPPTIATTQWEIRAVYKLVPNGSLPLPPQTIDTGWVAAGSRIDRIYIDSPTGNASTLIADIFSPGTGIVQLGLGGGGSGYQVLQIQSLNVREVSTAEPLLPYPLQQIAPGTPSQSGDVPITILIPITPGGQRYPVSIPAFIRNPGQIGIRPIPIIYDPSIPQDQRDALPQAWILPEGVQIGTGSGSDIITLTPDGAADTTDLTNTDSDYRRRNPPSVTTCIPEPDPGGDCCDCDAIREIVKEELDGKFPPSRPNMETTFVSSPQSSGEFVLPAFSQWVKLELIDLPSPSKSEYGGGGAPDVEYAGWYSFGAEGVTGQRYPINYTAISISLPPKTSGFSFTVVRGGTAKMTVGYLLEV